MVVVGPGMPDQIALGIMSGSNQPGMVVVAHSCAVSNHLDELNDHLTGRLELSDEILELRCKQISACDECREKLMQSDSIKRSHALVSMLLDADSIHTSVDPDRSDHFGGLSRKIGYNNLREPTYIVMDP